MTVGTCDYCGVVIPSQRTPLAYKFLIMAGWCGCCGALRPRYRRLVDNIYPANPEAGLVKSNMDKLVWYAANSPDKLDRIGEYLAHRLTRDIHRRRYGYACISMDAVDQLLVTCHANSLNLFVEFFLQMVQKLLECSEPALQLRATDSFEKFANIREDTPSYHRRYDFLVSKFSSLCHCSHQHPPTCVLLRTAGIRGLQGVVRKTDWNDLGENIWRPGHMEKLVPSLLYNIQDAPALQSNAGAGLDKGAVGTAARGGEGGESNTEDAVEGTGQSTNKTPPELAESCLRELLARVTFSRIGSVIRPLLVHMDQHKQWNNELMAVHVFKIIMYSIQAQFSINVVELLRSHLSDHRTSPSRCGIATVLGQIIPISAGECVGPSVIEMINSLLELVRLSMSETVAELAVGGGGVAGMVCQEEQQQYQDKLIHALAEYTHHLPDYHKIEAMPFILTKVPGSERVEEGMRPAAEVRLQHLLLNCLLKIARRYQNSMYYSSFRTAFLARLLRLSVSSDAVVRKLILQVLIALLPHTALPTAITLSTDGLSLTARNVPPVSQDMNFWKKCGLEILSSVQDGCQMANNSNDNFTAAYVLLVQLLVEVRAEDVPLDVIRTMLNMQEWAVTTSSSSGVSASVSPTVVASVHCTVAAVMAVAAALVPQLSSHVQAVITRRQEEAAWLLPNEGEVAIHAPLQHTLPPPHLLFNRQEIITLLQPTSLNEQRVLGSTSSMSSSLRRASTTMSAQHQLAHLSLGADSIQEETDSAASSPALTRRDVLTSVETVPFDAFKGAATGLGFVAGGRVAEHFRGEEERRRQQTYALLHDSYEALLARPQPEPLHSKLTEVLGRLPPPTSTLPPITPSFGLATTSPASTCNSFSGLKPLTMQLPYPDIVIC
ncbi:Armadillo-type fold [Trinorchestia longiramus]|nr:Armadillo-type fold [Trinorchestia longiramus]